MYLSVDIRANKKNILASFGVLCEPNTTMFECENRQTANRKSCWSKKLRQIKVEQRKNKKI